MTDIKNINFKDRYEVIALSLINNSKHISRNEAKKVLLERLENIGIDLRGSLTPEIYADGILNKTDKRLSDIGYSYSEFDTGKILNNDANTIASDFCKGLKTYNTRERNNKRNSQENYDDMVKAIDDGIKTLNNELSKSNMNELNHKVWTGYALDFKPSNKNKFTRK